MIPVPASIQEKTRQALHGDVQAFGIVFEWYRPRLYAHALRICGNTPFARDVVQDTYLSAFANLKSLRQQASFYPWLKRILVNHGYQLLRKERQVPWEDKFSVRDEVVHRSIDAHFENLADHQRLYATLRLLSDDLRSCLILRYFSQFNRYDQIAHLLGIPVGTVRSRLSAGREKLNIFFGKAEDSDDEAWSESLRWSAYYQERWKNIYNDPESRNELMEHHSPGINIRFTSGKVGKGRHFLEKEINDDLRFGSRFQVEQVFSSGNISVIEGTNFNHPDYPDRCAPSMALVVFRKNESIQTVHIFDSERAPVSGLH